MTTNAWNLPYSSLTKVGTLKEIEEIMVRSSKLRRFFPDNVKLKYISRDTIFTILHEVEPLEYSLLEKHCKRIKEKKALTNLRQFVIEVDSDVYKEIGELPNLEVKR